ncbi:MAG: DMT family transporter [Aminivibrio sp.]|jgi:DME family drug/metabolite transporter
MEKHGPVSRGAIFVLMGAVLWGTTGTSQALAPEGATPMAVGALRIVIGGGALLIVALLRGSFAGGGKWPLLPTAVAILATAAYQPLFFTGVAMTGVAVGTLITLASCPVITGVLGYFFFRERPSGRWYISSVLALAGCALLTLSGGGAEAADPAGMFFSLGAGFSYSVFVLGSKRLLRDRGADAVNGLVFSAAGLLLLPALAVSPPLWLLQPEGVLVAAHLGLIATALAYYLFLKGLTTIPASTGVTLTTAEPLTASLLGVFLLGERLSAAGAAGAAMLFLGLGLLASGQREEG